MEKELSSDDVADLLVRLYAEYCMYADNIYENDIYKDYSRAVAIAIRMLTD